MLCISQFPTEPSPTPSDLTAAQPSLSQTQVAVLQSTNHRCASYVYLCDCRTLTSMKARNISTFTHHYIPGIQLCIRHKTDVELTVY